MRYARSCITASRSDAWDCQRRLQMPRFIWPPMKQPLLLARRWSLMAAGLRNKHLSIIMFFEKEGASNGYVCTRAISATYSRNHGITGKPTLHRLRATWQYARDV